jgi:hypothetical protein
MTVEVFRVDVHTEVQGLSSIPVPHVFRCQPRASQSVLTMDGAGLLVRGDVFANEASPDHRAPKTGTFASPPTGRGHFTRAGQEVLTVDGIAVVTRAGRLETCDEIRPEMSCLAATRLDGATPLEVDGQPALPGR